MVCPVNGITGSPAFAVAAGTSCSRGMRRFGCSQKGSKTQKTQGTQMGAVLERQTAHFMAGMR